jgi:hypothetical protein
MPAAPTLSPGTEFSDAETGPRKSPPETANIRRDKNGRYRWRKSPHKRPIWTRLENLRFGRTGWWCAQSSETGLEHRNREFFGNFRPKQAFARLQAASHWKFLSDPRQLHGHRGTFLLFCKTGVRNAKTGRLERKIRSLNPPNRWWPADSKRAAIPPIQMQPTGAGLETPVDAAWKGMVTKS